MTQTKVGGCRVDARVPAGMPGGGSARTSEKRSGPQRCGVFGQLRVARQAWLSRQDYSPHGAQWCGLYPTADLAGALSLS